MVCSCVWKISEPPILHIQCDECKYKKKLLVVLRDFAIQWGQAIKYKKFEEFTIAELDQWILDYIDYRILYKKEPTDGHQQ